MTEPTTGRDDCRGRESCEVQCCMDDPAPASVADSAGESWRGYRAWLAAGRPRDENAHPVTPPKAAPKTAVDTGQGGELREALARWLWNDQWNGGDEPEPRHLGAMFWHEAHPVQQALMLERADALLAGPLAPLLAAQEAVERVDALADQLDRDAECTPITLLTAHAHHTADRIRAALDPVVSAGHRGEVSHPVTS
jgi:hypothetical protein